MSQEQHIAGTRPLDKAMTTALYAAALLPLCTQAIEQSQPVAKAGFDLLRDDPPVRVCPKHAEQGQFKLQLTMHRGRDGEVAVAQRALQLLDTLIGPLVGQRLQVEILEHSYGQYAQFALEVDMRQGLYRVMKTMNGQTWALCVEATLAEVLQFVQNCVFREDDDGTRLGER
jgi:hypothetical protein